MPRKPSNLAPTDPLRATRRRFLFAAAAGGVVSACGGGGGDSAPAPAPTLPLLPRPNPIPIVDGPAWAGFGGDAQHSALGGVQTQQLRGFYWYTSIDLAPQLNPNGSLTTHYGSPVITRHNTVIVPVKTGATSFRVDAREGATGDLKWTLASDYILPPHSWIPSFNPVLTQPNTNLATRLFMPSAGGRVLVRVDPDNAPRANAALTFYDNANTLYPANAAAFNSTVFINTPLVADAAGNVFFGFTVTGNNPGGPVSGGLARISAGGVGSFVTATDATGDAGLVKAATNCAPALSPDGSTVYAVFNSGDARPRGRLVALNATTLATLGHVALLDPANGANAWVSDDSTASPLVSPDGNDVYIGVLESATARHNFRGWLLHFNAALTQARTPGSFGWDNTPSIVPRAMVPQYTGTSNYLLLTKYNNYDGALPNGDGKNRLAILDPLNLTRSDPVGSGVTVMGEVITILGLTAEAGGSPGAVREWCINTAAVDPFTNSVLVNSEDGTMYRWHLPTNQFTEHIVLNSGLLQSYTPTAIGPDGRVYAVNSAILHSIGQ